MGTPTVTVVAKGDSVDYTPAAAVAAGDVIVQNDLVGVAPVAIVALALGAIAVEGVFDFPKDSGSATAIDAGEKVYWIVAELLATTTAGANPYLGKCVADAGVDDATVRVKLSQ